MKIIIFPRVTCVIILGSLFIAVIAMPTTDDVSVRMPSMAAKAGGKLKPELQENKNSNIGPEKKESQEEYEYDYDPEKDCNGDQFWHEGGQQCVPKLCNVGRDAKTGNCFPSGGSSSYYGSSGSNYYPQYRSGGGTDWRSRTKSSGGGGYRGGKKG